VTKPTRLDGLRGLEKQKRFLVFFVFLPPEKKFSVAMQRMYMGTAKTQGFRTFHGLLAAQFLLN